MDGAVAAMDAQHRVAMSTALREVSSTLVNATGLTMVERRSGSERMCVADADTTITSPGVSIVWSRRWC